MIATPLTQESLWARELREGQTSCREWRGTGMQGFYPNAVSGLVQLPSCRARHDGHNAWSPILRIMEIDVFLFTSRLTAPTTSCRKTDRTGYKTERCSRAAARPRCR